jgi:hypothetical protein
MPKTYTHRAIVSGRGLMPIDMLRYDSCVPATEADTAKIYACAADNVAREITVQRVTTERAPRWTPNRWASFGWSLTEAGTWQS